MRHQIEHKGDGVDTESEIERAFSRGDAAQSLCEHRAHCHEEAAGESEHGDDEADGGKHGAPPLQIAAAQQDPAEGGEEHGADDAADKTFFQSAGGVPEEGGVRFCNAHTERAAEGFAAGDSGGRCWDFLQEAVRHPVRDFSEQIEAHAEGVQHCRQDAPDGCPGESGENVALDELHEQHDGDGIGAGNEIEHRHRQEHILDCRPVAVSEQELGRADPDSEQHSEHEGGEKNADDAFSGEDLHAAHAKSDGVFEIAVLAGVRVEQAGNDRAHDHEKLSRRHPASVGDAGEAVVGAVGFPVEKGEKAVERDRCSAEDERCDVEPRAAEKAIQFSADII